MNLRQKDASTLGRTMGFALMVAFLSLGAISGCGSSSNDSYDFAGSGQPGGSDGVLGGEEPSDCINTTCFATTTKYAGFAEWPSYGSDVKAQRTYFYDLKTLEAKGFLVVATPFSFNLAANQNSRDTYIAAVINDAKCGRSDCNDSNSDAPKMCFQLLDGRIAMPQEFCGGNGWDPEVLYVGQRDVQNDCTSVVAAYAGGEEGLDFLCSNVEKFSGCEAFCTSVNLVGGSPSWLDLSQPDNMQKFINKGSCLPSPIINTGTYIAPTSANFTNACGNNQPNWCTGANMHFDGVNDQETGTKVEYTKVHCNIKGSQEVGKIGPPPVPPRPVVKNELVILFTPEMDLGAVSCEAGTPPTATTINAFASAPVDNSADSDMVTCYDPNKVFLRAADGSWSGPDTCVPDKAAAGAYRCIVTAPKPTLSEADYWQPATWTIGSFGKDPANHPDETTGTDSAWNLCNGVGKLSGCGQEQLGQPLWDAIQGCAKQPECKNGATSCTEPADPAGHTRFVDIWDVNAAYPMLVDGPEQMSRCLSQTHGTLDSKYPAIPNAEAKFEWFVDKFVDQKNSFKGQLFCVPGPAGSEITVRASVGHGTGTCSQLQLFKNPRNDEILAQMQGDTRSWSFESSGEYDGNGSKGGFCGEAYPSQGCSGAIQTTPDASGNVCIIPQMSRVFNIQGDSASNFSLPEGWAMGECP
jgi:hypothetical protein